MNKEHSKFPQSDSILSDDSERGKDIGRGIATRDREVIQRWAARHLAEPATGEASASGPATVDVNDGGAGVRFNFPGFARFRPISWDEWFEHFEEHGLTFVYEEDVADRAYALWQARGGQPGNDRDDWLEAERQLRGLAGGPGARYRLVKAKAGDEPA
ncbi:MAG: DUF2934 domain-containing protein [Acidobacteria bacterium]|nr:DUF2934 domain-containing protein [Acidobacteriota bacterium]